MSPSAQIVLAPPKYWYISTAADLPLTATFLARLVLHLRSVASPTAFTSFLDDDYAGETLNVASRFMVPISGQQHLEDRFGSGDVSGELDEEGEQSKHSEGDGVEVHRRRIPKK